MPCQINQKKLFKAVLQAGIILIILVLAFYLTKTVPDSAAIQSVVQSFGYPGLFIISVISGFNVIVPIPVIAFFSVFVESGLQPLMVIVLISLGMTTGDYVGFMIGDTGRKIAQSSISKQSLKTLTKLQERNPKLPLIVLGLWASLAPAPNEIIVIPLAFLGYKARYVMPIALVGNHIFNFLIAYGILEIYI